MKLSRLVGPVVAVLCISALTALASGASPAAGKPLPKRHAITQVQADAAGARSRQTQLPKSDPAAQLARAPRLSLDLHAVAGVPGAQALGLPKIKLESDGSVEVTVTGDRAAAVVRAVGGRILAQARGAVTATVRPSALRGLAATPGVDRVRKPTRAVTQADSEGVAKSGAAAWHTGGQTGSGITIAVVDAGFANLTAEKLALNLPVSTVVNGNHCADVNQTQHGTAVAEIVHQMAPDAQLLLYCVDDNVGFASAETELQAAGATVVNSSLGFPGDSRGDGYGAADSTVATVRKARQAGILWVQSAGNSAADHWSGTVADADHDGYVDLNGTGTSNRFDIVSVPPSGVAQLLLQWDQWPTSSATVALRAIGLQCIDAACTDYQPNPIGSFRLAHAPGTEPVLDIPTPLNTSSYDQDWAIYVEIGTGAVARRYDLSYFGDVEGFPSYLAGTNPARGAAGSISEPASSPYALAVGAADQADNTLEQFSSRGPTIDGRIKPDILGFDGTTSNLSDFQPDGFFGTSAAAPHVAGAAALVKAAAVAAGTPMDASEIQAFLEARATPNSNPATNLAGRGLLNLGPLANVNSPAGAGYTPLSAPVRVFDTRHPNFGTGTHTGPLLTNQQLAVDPTVKPYPAPAVPSGVPTNATAVVINLTGVSATGPTALSVFPIAYAGTSNLNLSAIDPLASVAAIVPMDVATHTFKIRDLGAATHALIDVVGYFSAAGTDGYASLNPKRILNTTNGLAIPQKKLVPGQVVDVPASVLASAGVPADAKSVIVNLGVVNQTGSGWFAVFPDAFSGTSNLNYTKYTRADLAITTLNSAGGFKLMNSSSSADATIDILGYLGGSSASARYVAIPSPVRIGDTRYGNGGRYGALPAGGILTLDGAKLHGVPFNAAGLWVGVTAVSNSSGYLSTFAAGPRPPGVSTLNFGNGRQVPNAAAPGLPSAGSSAGQFSTYASAPTQAIVDLFGYFK